MQQTVNLRVGSPSWLSDGEQQRAHEAACVAARAVQTVPYAVAPGVHVSTRRGLLGPGAEVLVDDIEGVGGRTPWQVLERLVLEQRVIARP